MLVTTSVPTTPTSSLVRPPVNHYLSTRVASLISEIMSLLFGVYIYLKPPDVFEHLNFQVSICRCFDNFLLSGATVCNDSLHRCACLSSFSDTSFMYMIAGLCMLKLYQKRHPDINASAYTAYACLALVIFFSVLGVVCFTLLTNPKKVLLFWV